MDQLPALGTAVGETVQPTQRIYAALLQPHADKIKSTPYKTFAYGPDPRNQLDVYYPSTNPSGADSPVLMWVYGGGLVNGAKSLPPMNGLAYANIGHFFAEKYGFVVVVIDYRLVPQATFPDGGEDVANAVEWVRVNVAEIGGAGKGRDLFIMGNSAGGVHLSTYLFSPVFAELREKVVGEQQTAGLRLRGGILLSVPFSFGAAAESRGPVLKTYYGERIREDCPLGLLESVKKETKISESLPGVKFLSLTETLDPEDEILLPNREFVAAWNAGGTSSDSPLELALIEGHNHISPCLSLSTGDPKEEAWGVQVAEFCLKYIEQ